MSRIARARTSPTPVAEKEDDAPKFADLSLEESETSSTTVRTTRVVFDVDATAAELMAGKQINITNAAAVFPVDEGKSRAKGLVTAAKVHSIYQDTGSSIRFDLNIHNTADERPAVDNALGLLHTPQQTDMGVSLATASGKFTTVMSLTPYEKQRFPEGATMYNPEGGASSKMLAKYGNYSADKLYDGVVPFEGEQYYLVDKEHVVLNVIRQNWESLGINLDDEHAFNGKYIQIAAPTFDKVASELKQQVLAKMPFTDLNNLAGKFTAVGHVAPHPEGPSGKYKVVVELGVEYQVM